MQDGQMDRLCNTYTQAQIVSVPNYALRHEGVNKWEWV